MHQYRAPEDIGMEVLLHLKEPYRGTGMGRKERGFCHARKPPRKEKAFEG